MAALQRSDEESTFAWASSLAARGLCSMQRIGCRGRSWLMTQGEACELTSVRQLRNSPQMIQESSMLVGGEMGEKRLVLRIGWRRCGV